MLTIGCVTTAGCGGSRTDLWLSPRVLPRCQEFRKAGPNLTRTLKLKFGRNASQQPQWSEFGVLQLLLLLLQLVVVLVVLVVLLVLVLLLLLLWLRLRLTRLLLRLRLRLLLLRLLQGPVQGGLGV